ncbi:SPFH domain-containing protein [Jiangella ureilytica]|uniref:SPFH domain-containing protein n=1 Tax=Jiangella ureilytica TaxID=2530374 RepID=A0A4R4RDJ7_9ACTN|nr:SPFH domain-containing protein [Jiangella ureilytica]TDC47277.1 SPFH domain-containing protein [Jiangella ureilytica]
MTETPVAVPGSAAGAAPGPAPVGPAGHRIDVGEQRAWAMSGFFALFLALAAAVYAVWQIVQLAPSISDAFETEDWAGVSGGQAGLAVLALVVAALLASPLVVIQPGQTRVVLFFGRYIGTVRRTGLVWVVPFTTRRPVSVRVNNFETAELKVNDADGNPVNIAAIVVWQVADTARATFAVEDYRDFVQVQSEAALRHVATSHPYDDASDQSTSLRGSTDVVSDELAHEVAARVAVAGVEILEVRISNLAYAQEIAQAMLQRQQAGAIVAARERIVEGAVSMVELALSRLERENVVTLDEERKAAMVSNLLVVLCGDQRATPVVNTGSLYT